MMTALNIAGTKERELTKYLQQYLSRSFYPTQNGVLILAKGAAKVHIGSIQWTYKGKEREETVEWSEKDLYLGIGIQLSRLLKSREVKASNVKAVQAMIGGDHGNTAFHFGAAITAELQDEGLLYFEDCCCKLVCRKDTSVLLEKTILPCLTTGLKVISMQALNIYSNADDMLLCSSFTPLPFHTNDPATIKVSVFITGDLAFQAMIMGREAMSGHHC